MDDHPSYGIKNSCKENRKLLPTHRILSLAQAYAEIGYYGIYNTYVNIVMFLYGVSCLLLIYSFILHTYVPDYTCDAYEKYKNSTSSTDTCIVEAKSEVQLKICEICQDQSLRFDNQTFVDLLTYKYKLYCEEEFFSKSLIISSIHFIGIILSMPLCSFFSDRYGRWMTTNIGNIFITFLSIGLYYHSNFWQVVFIKLLTVGICFIGYNCIAMTHLEVFASPKMKSIWGPGIYIHGPFSLFICGLMAKYLTTWRQVQRLVIISNMVITFLCFFVLDTPTFLLGKGRTLSAEKMMKRIGRINLIPPTKLDFSLKPTESKYDLEKQVGFFDIWRQGKASSLLNFAVFGSYLAAYNVYWGFSLNIGKLPLNFDQGFFITGAAGCTGALINVGMNFFSPGRRKLIQVYLTSALVSVILALVFETVGRLRCEFGSIQNIWTVLNVAASLIGIASVQALWFMINFVIVELYAPQVSVTAYSWLVVFGNIGGMLGPVYYQLYNFKFWLPFSFFIITVAVCLFLSVFIPESKGRELLLEPGEAKNRSDVHYSAVMKRLSSRISQGKQAVVYNNQGVQLRCY